MNGKLVWLLYYIGLAAWIGYADTMPAHHHTGWDPVFQTLIGNSVGIQFMVWLRSLSGSDD